MEAIRQVVVVLDNINDAFGQEDFYTDRRD